MRFAALATDYDETLADEGIVSMAAIETLRRFRASGRRVILLTGRTFASLLEVFPCPDEFDIIVAENGATLYNPATKSEKAGRCSETDVTSSENSFRQVIVRSCFRPALIRPNK